MLLSKTDRIGQLKQEDNERKETVLCRNLKYYHKLMERPFVQEADLIAAGFAPGPGFEAALKYARKLHLSGVNIKRAKKAAISFLKRKRGLPPCVKR